MVYILCIEYDESEEEEKTNIFMRKVVTESINNYRKVDETAKELSPISKIDEWRKSEPNQWQATEARIKLPRIFY